MQELKKLIEASYFTVVFLVFVEIITVYITIRNRNKFDELKNFHYYPLAALFQSIVFFSSLTLPHKIRGRIMDGSISVFLLIEFLAIYLFALRIILSKKDRAILKVIFCCYLLYLLSLWAFTNAFINYYKVFVIQSAVLLVPSVFYFLQIFKNPSNNNPAADPIFWINTGIFFLFSFTIPLSLLENYSRFFITHNQYLYSISYLGYTIFFILICKGYLCKPVTELNCSL